MSSVDLSDDWDGTVSEYGSAVSGFLTIPNTANVVTPIQLSPARRPATGSHLALDNLNKASSAPLSCKLRWGAQNNMRPVCDCEEVKVDVGKKQSCMPNVQHGSKVSNFVSPMLFADSSDSWDEEVKEYGGSVDTLPTIPSTEISSAPIWLPSASSRTLGSKSTTDGRNKGIRNGIDVSDPIKPMFVPCGNNSGSKRGVRNSPKSLEDYIGPRFLQVEGDAKYHWQNWAAPTILGVPPLPTKFSDMNDSDKEEILKKWIRMHYDEECEQLFPTILVKTLAEEDGLSKNQLQDVNFPKTLREEYNIPIKQKRNSTTGNTEPCCRKLRGAALKSPPEAAAMAALSSEDARNSFHRTPGETLEDEESTTLVDNPSPTEKNQRSWTLFADGDGYCEGDKKRRKKYTAKTKSKGKSSRDFEFIRLEQIIVNHEGLVCTMKFNHDGKYLATGGQDSILRVWTTAGTSVDKARWKKKTRNGMSPRISSDKESGIETTSSASRSFPLAIKVEARPPKGSIINPNPYREYRGHRMGILDIDWSKGTDFILSSSFDTTVKLWHPSKKKCLCTFQHWDYVTSIRFHPSNSAYFVSAGFDSRIRLWNILDARVVAYGQLKTLITAVAFSPNGKIIAAGLDDGQCVFFIVDMDQSKLKQAQKVDCRNGRKSGRKVTSIEYLPTANLGEGDVWLRHGSSQCLVTTNDSRIRLFNLKSHHIKLTTKYKGVKNSKLQIAATFSHDGRYVICGSEDGAMYIWNRNITNRPFVSLNKTTHQKTKSCEIIRAPGSMKDIITVAIFAPPKAVSYIAEERMNKANGYPPMPKFNYIILTANNAGGIKVFVNYISKPRPGAGEDIQEIAQNWVLCPKL